MIEQLTNENNLKIIVEVFTSKFIALIILALMCSLGSLYADYPGTVWRSQLAVPNNKYGNIKANILSLDESKIYVHTQRELFVYKTEDGGLHRMYIDELSYPDDSRKATFTAGALSADGTKFFIIGLAYLTEDNVENKYNHFFVFDLSSEKIVYDELFAIDKYLFPDMVYSPGRESVYISSYSAIMRINTNDYSDRYSSSYYKEFVEKMYISPDDNHLVLQTFKRIDNTNPPGGYFLAEFITNIDLSENKVLSKKFVRKVYPGPMDIYKRGCFTQDSKYFCQPDGNIMRVFNAKDDKVLEYYTQADLGETPYFLGFCFF